MIYRTTLGKYTTQISNVEIYDNKYKKDLEEAHKKIFEMGKTNELQQRTIEDMRRDYDSKVRHLEEQLSASERVISELKVQCNDGRQRHMQGELTWLFVLAPGHQPNSRGHHYYYVIIMLFVLICFYECFY